MINSVRDAYRGKDALTFPEAKALDEAQIELERALDRFPKFNSFHEGYAVILEELDELWDQVKLNPSSVGNMRREACQVVAMALRFMMELTDEISPR